MPDRGPLLPHDDAKKHYAWRSRVNAHLPGIGSRVFALRHKMYMGCGFHYGLERDFGRVLAMVNDHNKPLTLVDSVIDKVVFEGMLRTLVKAEFSARGWNLPGRPER